MKKALFAAFAVVCVISSLLAGTGKNGRLKIVQTESSILRDTIPGKTDTSRYPKHDTTNMPRFADGQIH